MADLTKNIPRSFPDWVHEEDRPKIVEWVKTRPEHPDDQSVNRRARWTYLLTDHGVFTDVKVRDNSDGSVFCVPVDLDSI